MRKGDKAYKTVNGKRYQCALFPLDYMNCTQISSPNSYSHCCGNQTDWVGVNAKYPYYAPVDCTRINLAGSDNICYYVSDEEVLCPDGIHRLAFVFMHDNTPPAATHYNQGDLIGHTGTAGFVTGDHVHLEQAFNTTARLISSGITCQSGTNCWYLEGTVPAVDAFFITGSETIINLRGQNFVKIDDYDPSEGESKKGLLWFILGIGSGKKKYMGVRR